MQGPASPEVRTGITRVEQGRGEGYMVCALTSSAHTHLQGLSEAARAGRLSLATIRNPDDLFIGLQVVTACDPAHAPARKVIDAGVATIGFILLGYAAAAAIRDPSGLFTRAEQHLDEVS